MIWAFVIAYGSVFAGKHAWVEADTAACDGPKGQWATAPCNVTGSTLKQVVGGSRKRKRTYYRVTHVATVIPEGQPPYEATVWKAPSWAEGYKEHGGSKLDVMFSDKDTAKAYRRTFSPGTTAKCYYNPKDPSKVSFRCRDEPMRQRYIGGVTTICVAVGFPFAIFLVLYLVVKVAEVMAGENAPVMRSTRRRSERPSPPRVELVRHSSFREFPWLSSRAITDLRRAFTDVDTSGNGTLSRDELVGVASRGGATQKTIRKLLGVPDEDILAANYWKQLFTSMDTNHDNTVSFKEFVLHLCPPPDGDSAIARAVVNGDRVGDAVLVSSSEVVRSPNPLIGQVRGVTAGPTPHAAGAAQPKGGAPTSATVQSAPSTSPLQAAAPTAPAEGQTSCGKGGVAEKCAPRDDTPGLGPSPGARAWVSQCRPMHLSVNLSGSAPTDPAFSSAALTAIKHPEYDLAVIEDGPGGNVLYRRRHLRFKVFHSPTHHHHSPLARDGAPPQQSDFDTLING